MKVVATMYLAIIPFAISSCVSYNKMREIDPEYRDQIEKNKLCYLEKAKKQAAFVFDCKNVEVQVLEKKNREQLYRDLQPLWSWFATDFEEIQTISAQGCGHKIVLHTFCEMDEKYYNSSSPEICPCRVVQSGNLESRLKKKNEAIKQRNDAAAAAAAAAAARRKQEEQQQRQQRVSPGVPGTGSSGFN